MSSEAAMNIAVWNCIMCIESLYRVPHFTQNTTLNEEYWSERVCSLCQRQWPLLPGGGFDLFADSNFRAQYKYILSHYYITTPCGGIQILGSTFFWGQQFFVVNKCLGQKMFGVNKFRGSKWVTSLLLVLIIANFKLNLVYC